MWNVYLIGKRSSEDEGYDEQKYIKRELQASLYNGVGNTRNGILGIVLPSMVDTIYRPEYICSTCGKVHNYVGINDSIVIKEFSKNYYISGNAKKCCWSEEERYCVLVKWEDFVNAPQTYINKAFNKRRDEVSAKVTVYPK